MALTNETFTLIKPFVVKVNASGFGSVEITHSLQGIIWQVFQIGFALGQTAFNPQIGAHMNGIPLTSSVAMQPVAFTGFPYAMESFFVGPPYVGLKAGDKIVCAVTGAAASDVFTAGAYISEEDDPAFASPPWWSQ